MNPTFGAQLDAENVEPGSRLTGRVGWSLPKPPKSVKIHLFWQTSGKGTEDIEIVDKKSWEHPTAQGLEPFAFDLPIEPYSFSGRLITVRWGVETVIGNQTHTAFFTMAPGGDEIHLGK